MVCTLTSVALGQHANPRESRPNPATRPTAMPPPERPTPKSKWLTTFGVAISATPVMISSPASSSTSILLVMGLNIEHRLRRGIRYRGVSQKVTVPIYHFRPSPHQAHSLAPTRFVACSPTPTSKHPWNSPVRYGLGGGGGSTNEQESGGGGSGGVSARPCGALEITPEGTRFTKFDDHRTAGIALALGFVLGAAVVALKGRDGSRQPEPSQLL